MDDANLGYICSLSCERSSVHLKKLKVNTERESSRLSLFYFQLQLKRQISPAQPLLNSGGYVVTRRITFTQGKFQLAIILASLLSLAACDDGKSTEAITETVPRCSVYFISDFNNIVRLDRLKNGYSAEMSGLCAGFETKHKHFQKCSATLEETGETEIVHADVVRAICGRNEKLIANIDTSLGLLKSGTDQKDILKFMVVDDTPFTEVRESSRDFARRKVFAGGKTVSIANVTSNSRTPYCLFSSNLPLSKDSIVVITSIEDNVNNSIRTVNYMADVMGGTTSVSIACVAVGAKETPTAILKKHLGNAVIFSQ